MVILIACIAGYLAYKIGAWRHYCMIWEKELPENLPNGWRKTELRIGTWIIVTGCSLYSAYVISLLIGTKTTEMIGKFSFGVILMLRILASHFSAQAKCEIEKKIIEERDKTWMREHKDE